MIVAVIVAAVFVGSNPDVQSEITAFLDGLSGSGATPPPTSPQTAAAPQPTKTPVPPTPTPAPPFEWATVVTPEIRALKSGDVPASGYHEGWFGSLSEDAFTYDGKIYNVLEILYRESEGELSVRLDSCLRPTALYALRVGSAELRWPTSEHSEQECLTSQGSQQSFRFTADEPVIAAGEPVAITLILIAQGLAEATPQPAPTKQSETAPQAAVVSPTPMPVIVPTATPAPTRAPALRPAPAPIIVPTSTPAPTATPTPHSSPELRHLDLKQYMLELINEERAAAGLGPVALGDNIAAQLHAESSLENCFSGHWGKDGLKPYMRYSLAGGYQSNSESGLGSDYCIEESDGYVPTGNVRQHVLEGMEGWMDSPGHRRNILGPTHKKVNIGLAWDRYNFIAIQHFEGDYVRFDSLPSLDGKILAFSGTLKNGAGFGDDGDLGVQIYYDPPPHPLTRGQLSRTYCYDSGRIAAALRRPLTANEYWPENEFTRIYKPCPSPYDVDPESPAPRSHDEAHEFWQTAYDASQDRQGVPLAVPWITAHHWRVTSNSFSVKADIGDVPAGVYTIAIWAHIGGESEVVSEYSIFHGVTPPDTYTP